MGEVIMYRILLFRLLYILLILPVFAHSREIKWNWSNIEPTNIYFPPHFLWGCADSALQTEGIITTDNNTIENSWTEFEKTSNKSVCVGSACERWTRYKSDFALLKDIGMNTYRFSIEWS